MTAAAWVELRQLAPGTRFRFLAFRDQVATLVEKGPGRALIRYDRSRDPDVRTFEARDPKTGARVRRTVVVHHANDVEPCALGAQVVPLVALQESPA